MCSMRQADFRKPRTCVVCAKNFSGEEIRREIGWTPLRSGWRCPDCSRAHARRVAALADALIRDHRRYDWLGAAEHAPYDGCVFCDVLAAATDRLLRQSGADP
jgi:hypothetical protein